MRPVPNRPLIWLALLLVVPGTTMVVYSDGAAGQIGWGALSIFALISLIDLFLSKDRLDGVVCEVPELLCATKG